MSVWVKAGLLLEIHSKRKSRESVKYDLATRQKLKKLWTLHKMFLGDLLTKTFLELFREKINSHALKTKYSL